MPSRPLRLAALLALLTLVAPPARAETTTITLLHTADLHGALDEYDYAADRPAKRGLVRVGALVRNARETSPGAVLLLDAGDCIQGGGVEAVFHAGGIRRGDPMMQMMSRIGYDAMAVGNHEFDFGPAAIDSARRDASFPWLCANAVRADGKPAFTPALVKTVSGVKVGVVGLCTPAVPFMTDSANIAGLRFLSPVEAARAEVARLRERERCDVVVLLAHTGLERDSAFAPPAGGFDENWGGRLATQVPGVDVVILGHAHAVIPSLTIGGALVTEAGKLGENLGRVEITLERASASAPWRVTSRRAQVISTGDVGADSTLAALARPTHGATQGALDRPLGRLLRPLSAPRGRYEDSGLWDLIHRAQLAASGADVSLSALFDPAAVIDSGAVTARDALRLYPYENTLVVVELSGEQLKRVLERAASALNTYTYEDGRPLLAPGAAGYDFDSAEGLSYEIDLTRPPGDRVLHLRFQDAPLAPDRRLKVAINSYRANGGGGYPELREAPRLWTSAKGVRDLIADYIRSTGRLDGTHSPNWRLLPDYAVTPERPLIDRLVRQGVAPRAEVQRLEADFLAQRGDVAYWLARAFGWREKRLSGAFADVPDSLEPWLDGLLKRNVLGTAAGGEYIKPFLNASVGTAVDWCERAARYEDFALASPTVDMAYRRGLVAGTSIAPDSIASMAVADYVHLTRAQLLGIISNARFPTLRVLETTDFHGAILTGARERRTQRPIGGSAVLAAWIARLTAENPAGTLLVDGGDLFQGTMISNLQFGRPVIEQMNTLGYAASVIGNHEFDWGVDTLVRRVHEMKFAALGANLVEKKNGRMPAWVRSDTVVSRRGVRVGILGLCYRYTPTVTLAANVAALRFEDDSTTTARGVPRLRKTGKAQVVVVVGHTPAETDSTHRLRSGDLARVAAVPGIDVVLGGHSHNLVSEEHNGIPVMISGALGQCVGVCDLVVDPVKSRVIERSSRLVTTYADEVTVDPVWASRVEKWNTGVAPIAAQIIGRNLHTLTRGSPESAVGDFVADAMREKVRADVALQNTGGLRDELAAGPVTRGAIYEVMPFDNTIYTMDLTGAELKLALEQSLMRGRVTQVSGIQYRYDSSRPDLDKVTSLTLAGGTAVDSARTYKVACNNFMATGGDNYDVLGRGGANRTDTGLLVREAMEEMVRAKSAGAGGLELEAGGRITRVGRENR